MQRTVYVFQLFLEISHELAFCVFCNKLPNNIGINITLLNSRFAHRYEKGDEVESKSGLARNQFFPGFL